jgi:hypothetical protein
MGRIENLCLWPKHVLNTHLFPTNDYPFIQNDVLLFQAASSMNINMSRFMTLSAILFMNAEHSRSSLSNTQAEALLQE